MAHNVKGSYSLQRKIERGDCVISAVDSVCEDYLGIDIEENGYEEVRERYGFNVEKQDFLESDFDEEFDIILAFDVLDHIPNLDLFYSKVRNALKEDGSLIVSDDRPFSQRKLFKLLISGKSSPADDNMMYLDSEILSNHADRYGFEVVDKELIKPMGTFSPIMYKLLPAVGAARFYIELKKI